MSINSVITRNQKFVSLAIFLAAASECPAHYGVSISRNQRPMEWLGWEGALKTMLLQPSPMGGGTFH